MDRRAFVGTALSCVLLPRLSSGFGRRLAAPSLTVSVRRYGAAGNGIADDTDAFARAAAAVARAGGGTIVVDDGTYLIDPDFTHGRSIRLPSNTTLRLSTRATLRARPGALPVSAVVHLAGVTNAHVVGGTIIGERAGHSGTSGEWGMGVQMHTAHGCSVRGTRITGCWGDGIYVGAPSPVAGSESTDVVIDGVTCDGNRRQGVSVVAARRVTITNSQFLNTHGTPPAAGIDFEPDPGTAVVSDCVVRQCRIEGNDVGVQLTPGARRVTLALNTLRGNRRIGVWVLRGAIDTTIDANVVEQADAASTGILVEAPEGMRVTGNTVRGRYRQALVTPSARGAGNLISGNRTAP